ncbi:hypothetical protein [Natrarchaeobaculum sulfurireducens]|uniref:hypothetical protein n=1 Tax=Natrarchaeobaculum sulfurireducens TaxID=2044521 RepID=UPI000E3D2B99|nr:hypothetical protein [Natrarchaeobaculum sulfurireducens]
MLKTDESPEGSEYSIQERDIEVLSLVAEYEPVRSSTIAEAVHWASDGGDVNYRLQKLEAEGLIWREEVEDPSLPLNPKVSRITPDGHERLATPADDRPKTIEQRVDRLEKQVGTMRETYGQVKQRIVDAEEQINEMQEDVDGLDDEFDEVARTLERVLEAFEVADSLD